MHTDRQTDINPLQDSHFAAHLHNMGNVDIRQI